MTTFVIYILAATSRFMDERLSDHILWDHRSNTLRGILGTKISLKIIKVKE